MGYRTDKLPQKDSYAYKLYEYLLKQPRDTELTSATVAYDIVSCDPKDVPAFLGHWVEHGLFVKRMASGRAHFKLNWDYLDQSPDGAAATAQPTTPQTTWALLGSKPQDAAAANAPAAAADEPPADEDTAKAESFNFALFGDGELGLYGMTDMQGNADVGVVLNAQQTARLREYFLHTGSYCEAKHNH